MPRTGRGRVALHRRCIAMPRRRGCIALPRRRRCITLPRRIVLPRAGRVILHVAWCGVALARDRREVLAM